METSKSNFGVFEKITFLSDLLEKQIQIRNMLDLRANIMIGFNSALIVIFVSEFRDIWTKNVFFIIGIAIVVASMILAIMALKPSHILTKKGQRESLFYHHYIDSKEEEEYRHEIYRTLDHENNIFDAYVMETYNLTKYSNVPRKKYLNLSIRILIYGMLFGATIYALSLLISWLPKLFGM